jgi:hypothetical protein
MREEVTPHLQPADRRPAPVVVLLAGQRSRPPVGGGLDVRLASGVPASGRKDLRWSTTTSS